MNPLVENSNWYKTNFHDFEKQLNGQAVSVLHQLRQQAIANFTEMGFPTLKKEEWRFTNITPIQKTEFRLAQDQTLGQTSTDLLETVRFKTTKTVQLVFMNGKFIREMSVLGHLPNKVIIKSLAAAYKENQELLMSHLAKGVDYRTNVFGALNTAFINDGAFVYIPDSTIMDVPIHIIYITDPGDETLVTHPRNLYLVGKSSQVKIVESYAGASNSVYFTNPVTEIIAGENAVVDHYKVQKESAKAYHIAVFHSRSGDNSNLTSHSFAFGGAIVRNELVTILDGQGCDVILNGLYLANNNQLVDNHSLIEHAKPHCHSREVYHGILDDKARAVFSGKIHVLPDAQKTDAVQSNKNILLSEDATVDTKPQLEIFADDVKCTHGGSIGQIDENGIFYLRSRGIEAKTAKNMMIHAFAGELINAVKIEELRDMMDNQVVIRLNDGHLIEQ